ncbi:MAG TPA: CBS domain-containing protein [Polyangiaceae bacterium]|jgi:CBS domain-containing protein|nr:CBS domain-containing protein [Polyangiaceae bacterium]
MITVSELMTKKVSFVRADESLSAAAKKMWDGDCGAVPVIDAGSARVVGMITDRDIAMSVFLNDRPPSAMRVADAMSRGLHSCFADDAIETAEDLMREKQIRRLPVVDTEGALTGILSLADLVKKPRGNGKKKAIPQIAPENVAATLAIICTPPAQEISKPVATKRASSA